METRLLTIPIVARRLDVGVSTIYRMIGEKKLRCIRCGAKKGYRVPESEVQKILASWDDPTECEGDHKDWSTWTTCKNLYPDRQKGRKREQCSTGKANHRERLK